MDNANPEPLRGDIDSGLTGDKAAAVDPAAAPLGTDNEAAGERLSPAAVAMDRKNEQATSAPGAGANASSAEITPSGMGVDTRWLAPALAGAALGVVFSAVLAATL